MSGLDPKVPNVARMYDFYLGGKDNFEIDRQAAQQVLEAAPQTPALARANRAFLQRAVAYLAQDVGITQFLDIGAGLPTQGNVHEVAQGCRVVYVDNDAVVLAHARALLATTDDTIAVPGDLREPDKILADPDVRDLLDLDQPVAVLLVSVLHCLTEEEDPYARIATLRDALPSGSHLVLSHISPQERIEAAQRGAEVYRRASTTMTLRDRAQITRMFDGFDVLDPGVVELQDWRPEPVEFESVRLPGWFLCGVGRKP